MPQPGHSTPAGQTGLPRAHPQHAQPGQPSRDKLLHVAIDLIWNASYESVGVNDICRRAEVTKGCFYHHFKSKAELFYAASEQYWQNVKPQLDAIVSPSLNALEQLCELAAASAQAQAEHSHGGNPVAGCPFLATAAQIGHREPLAARAGQEMTGHFLKYLSAIIRNLIAEGYAETTLPPEQTARLIHQYYQGVMQFARTFQSREAVTRDIAEGMAQLIGLKPEYRDTFRRAYRF